MKNLTRKFFLFYLIIPSIVVAETSIYKCTNQKYNYFRYFKVDLNMHEMAIYSLYEDTFYPLCSSKTAVLIEDSLLCMYGAKNNKNQVATLFPKHMNTITDFLLSSEDLASDYNTWKQKIVSSCLQVSDLKFN